MRRRCGYGWLGILPAVLVFVVFSCNDTFMEDEKQSVQESEGVWLNDILNQLDLEAGIILVQNGESIQDAVQAAQPGNTIYIEPGTYKETLTIDKPDIRLMGLKLDDEGVVLENPGKAREAISLNPENLSVDVANITFKNFEAGVGQTSPLKTKRIKRTSCVHESTREALGNGIAHYYYKLRVGFGEYDVVGLHRIVKENQPYHPIRTKGDIFMIHGAPQDFDDIFLTAGASLINEQTSAPFYLADMNIDVWGIDLGWTLVPEETSDFSFMDDWGLEKEIDHTLAAMSVARLIRGLTRQSFQRINMLGYCSGGLIVYGAAGRETQIHPILRHVKGIIPVDAYVLHDNATLHQVDCDAAAAYKASLDAGIYQSEDGIMLAYLCNLALNQPDQASPIPDFDGLTNRQVVMMLGTSPNDPVTEWQFFGGTMDSFNYTDPARFFRLGVSLPPYMPNRMLYENYAVLCDPDDVTFDDHIGDIALPILNIATGGGFGDISYYTPTMTSSSDIQNYMVSIPGMEKSEDYAHADIWLGYDADEMLWSELYAWLIEHTRPHRW